MVVDSVRLRDSRGGTYVRAWNPVLDSELRSKVGQGRAAIWQMSYKHDGVNTIHCEHDRASDE